MNPSEPEMRLIQTWLDIGVTYLGAYVAAPHQAGAGKADEELANRRAQCHKKDRKDLAKENVQFESQRRISRRAENGENESRPKPLRTTRTRRKAFC